MKVYFTCSTAEFDKYKKTYRKIRDFLVSEKHVLTRDWLDLADNRIKKQNINLPDIEEIYKKCIKAIDDADLVIIEDTVSNFSTGHQITMALQRKRPTLVLWQGEKHRHFKKMFIHGIKSDFLQVEKYDDSNLEDVIKAFINKYEDAKSKNRFHLVLSQLERNYLDWVQFNKGRSRTRVIRDAIREQIERDEEYKRYLVDGE